MDTKNAAPSTRIASMLKQMQPTEQRVAELLSQDMVWAVEATANELAARAQVGRTTVIRTAQKLGYDGYQQLRVAMTLEVATRPAPQSTAALGGVLGSLQNRITEFTRHLSRLTDLIESDALDRVAATLAQSPRVLVVGNGLSASLAQDFAGRLSGRARPAEFIADSLTEQIAASLLGAQNACVVISGSGANHLSLESARAAQKSGATVIGVTSFVSSPLENLADLSVLIPSMDGTFQKELEHTSRVPYQLVLETLAEVIPTANSSATISSREAVYDVLGRSLEE
ncbi:MurR/RpiR family transcriptional regulator [Corynebacterium sp. H127]|uniref:MurR/RpiR family transcriptional regulator n=1 Tax=Corynebacterium sp. H127 TaxID=3133418 RepID=UPI00309538E3